MSSYTPARSSDSINELEHDVTTAAKKVLLTGAATSGLAKESTQLLIKTAVQVMDDWDESNRAKVNPIVGQAGIAAGAGAVDALTQRATLASDDPAVTLLGTIDADTGTIAGDTTAISGKITQLARTNGYEQPATTDDAQIVHDVSVKIPPKAEYTSPNDFTATYTSNVTLTLASLGITITDASQIKYIKQLNASNNVFILVNGVNGVTFTEAADVITVAGAGTPLAAADVYEVGIDEQRKGYDATNKLWKTQDQSQVWTRFVDWDQLVTSAQDLTGSMVTMGSVISSLSGYRYLRIPFLLDGNDSRSVQVQVSYEVAASGTFNIPYDPNKWTVRNSILDTAQKIRTLTGTVSASLDDWFSVEVELDNCPPAEIKVQVMAGTVGGTAGQIDNAYYIKGY